MKRFIGGGRRRAVIAAAALALVVTGVAVAAWIITSTGPSGYGGLGTLQAPTVAYPASAPAGDCFPGSTCAVTVSVTNPNANPVVLTGVTFTGSASVQKPLGTDNSIACPTSNIVKHDLSGLSISVPTGTTTLAVPGAYTLSSSAPTACQGSVVYVGGATTSTWSFATS